MPEDKDLFRTPKYVIDRWVKERSKRSLATAFAHIRDFIESTRRDLLLLRKNGTDEERAEYFAMFEELMLAKDVDKERENAKRTEFWSKVITRLRSEKGAETNA